MTLLLWPALGTFALVVLWGAFLVGAKVNVLRRSTLPKRIPGMAHESELVAWDLLYFDVDVWQALYGERACAWGLDALTEPTAAYRTVGFEIPEPTTYEGASA